MKIQGLPVEYGCSDVDFKIEGSPRGIGKTWKPCLKCGRIALKYRQCAYYSHIVCTDCYTGPRDQDWCDECMDNFLALDVNIPESVYGQMKVTSPTFSGILSELKFRKLPNPPSTSRSTTAGYKTPFGPAPKTPGFPTTPAPSYLESNWKKGTRYSEPFDSDTDSDWDDCEWFDYYGFDDYYRKPIEFSGPLRKCPPLGRSLYPPVEESSFERNSYNDLTSKWNKSSSNSRRSSFRLNDFPKDGMSQYYNSFVPRPIAYSALPRDQKPPNFGSMSNPSTAQLKKHESVKPYFLMEQPNKKQTVDPVNTENPNFKTKSQEKKSSDGQLKKDHISFKQLTAEVKEMEKKLFSTMKASAKEANPIDTDRTKVSAKNATRADGFETTLSKSASVVNAIKSQNQRMKSFFIDFDILATVGRLDHLEVVHNIPMLLVFKMRDDRVTVELCLKGVRGLSAGSLLNKKVFFYVLNATGAIVRMHEIDTSINGHQPRFAYGGSPTGVQYDVIFDHEHDDILTGTFMELAVDVSPFTGVPDM